MLDCIDPRPKIKIEPVQREERKWQEIVPETIDFYYVSIHNLPKDADSADII